MRSHTRRDIVDFYLKYKVNWVTKGIINLFEAVLIREWIFVAHVVGSLNS